VVTLLGDDGWEIGVEEIRIGLVKYLASVAVVVVVRDVDGERVLGGLVRVHAERNLAIAETVHFVEGQHL
jgi:hypothetical protein